MALFIPNRPPVFTDFINHLSVKGEIIIPEINREQRETFIRYKSIYPIDLIDTTKPLQDPKVAPRNGDEGQYRSGRTNRRVISLFGRDPLCKAGAAAKLQVVTCNFLAGFQIRSRRGGAVLAIALASRFSEEKGLNPGGPRV